MEPAKPRNAYWIWLGENRVALAQEAGSAKGPVMMLAGAKWKALPEAAKAPFQKRAAEQKSAYCEQAMQDFKAQGGELGKLRRESSATAVARDPNRPKRTPTAYWLWLSEARAPSQRRLAPQRQAS